MAAEDIIERRQYLLRVIDNLMAKHQAYCDDVGQNGVPLESDLAVACAEVLEVFESGTIPESCRNLLAVIQSDFAPYWREYASRASVSSDPDLAPGDNVWKGIENIATARENANPKPPPTIESFATLVAQGVSPEQICLIKNWVTDGRPDIHKVNEELAKPGTHEKSDQMTPAAKTQQAQKQKRAAAAVERKRKIEEKKRRNQPAPESIEDLAGQGVALEQIATMKKISEVEVLAACDAAGIDHPAPLESLHAGRQQFEPELDATEETRLDAVAAMGADDYQDAPEVSQLSIEQQVLQAIDADPIATHGDIAAQMGLSRQRVTAILNRRHEIEDPSAV